MGELRMVNAEGVGKLPAFSHAAVAGDLIFVSGTLGTRDGSFELAEGGALAETRQALQNIRSILEAAGATLRDVVKVNVFLTEMDTFSDMNRAYREFFPSDPPARITVGCAGLALDAAVEIDCVAVKPRSQASA